MFDSAATERLRFYVYVLFDPMNANIPFYVGKGQNNRVFSHAAGELLEASVRNEFLSPKLSLITEIKKRGDKVIQKIVRSGLTERDALIVEASLIDMVNHIKPESLKNQISGHGTAEGFIDALDLAVELGAQPLQTDIPVIIIKIERCWERSLVTHKSPSSIPIGEIYDAVRGNWRVSTQRAERADCVLAVAKGLVRAVFTVDRWYASNEDGRKRFDGVDASQQFATYLGKSVSCHFDKGGQNPIRYLNCD